MVLAVIACLLLPMPSPVTHADQDTDPPLIDASPSAPGLTYVAVRREDVAAPSDLTVLLLDELSIRMGVEIDIKIMRRAAAERAVRQGSIDFMSLNMVESRRGLIQSIPHSSQHVGIFRHTDVPDIVDFASLDGYRASCPNVPLLHAAITSRDVEATCQLNILHGMLALSRGEIDAFICATDRGVRTVRNHELQNIEVANARVMSSDRCFVVSERNPELMSQLNEHLEAMATDGRLDEILALTTPEMLTPISWAKRNRLMLTIGGVAICLLLISLIWTVLLLRLNHARRRAIRVAEEREARLRTIVDSEPACVKVVAIDRTLIDMNPAGLAMVEADSVAQVRGCDVADLISAEHRAAFDDLHTRVCRGESAVLEMRIVGLEGTSRWVETHAAPLRDADGVVTGQLAVTYDISERKRTDERQRILTRELDHRVKNNLASVVSLAKLTAHSTATPAAFVKLFSERLSAMARTHEALARSQWHGVDLNELARLIVGPFIADETRATWSGPDVIIESACAQPLALALNELAVNAATHGALSSTTGHIEITWATVGDRTEVHWTEHDGPHVTPPEEYGMGLGLVTGFIERDLRGELDITFAPEGFTCTIALPVTAMEPAAV